LLKYQRALLTAFTYALVQKSFATKIQFGIDFSIKLRYTCYTQKKFIREENIL